MGSIKIHPKIIRDVDRECYQAVFNSNWGAYLMHLDVDPERIELSDFEKTGIKLIDDFPRIPADYWSAWISLCFYMCPSGNPFLTKDTKYHSSQLEVQVILLRRRDDLSKWKIVVPQQRVSDGSVRSTLKNSIDILTGEEYTQFPPEGWCHAGSSHSHNLMSAFFSSIDDRDEMGVPGMHIVVGHINHSDKTYGYAASIVGHQKRMRVKLPDVVDITALEKPFHPKVTTYIKEVMATFTEVSQEQQRKLGFIEKKIFSFPNGKWAWDSDDEGDEPHTKSEFINDLVDLAYEACEKAGLSVDEVIEALEEARELIEENLPGTDKDEDEGDADTPPADWIDSGPDSDPDSGTDDPEDSDLDHDSDPEGLWPEDDWGGPKNSQTLRW